MIDRTEILLSFTLHWEGKEIEGVRITSQLLVIEKVSIPSQLQFQVIERVLWILNASGL